MPLAHVEVVELRSHMHATFTRFLATRSFVDIAESPPLMCSHNCDFIVTPAHTHTHAHTRTHAHTHTHSSAYIQDRTAPYEDNVYVTIHARHRSFGLVEDVD